MVANNDKHVDLSTSLAGGAISLSTCIYNASGPRSGTVAALQKVATSSSTGAILSKSATLLSQSGNVLPRTHHDDDGMASFNSEGLPNNGIDYYINASNIQEILRIDDKSSSTNAKKKKPYFVSLSGKTTADNMEMLQRIFQANEKHFIAQQQQQDSAVAATVVDALLIQSVELNLACPNIIGKPIIGYDVKQVEDTLQQVDQVYKNAQQQQQASESKTASLPVLGIKLPPYLDFVLLEQVANVLKRFAHVIHYIVCINTVGNTLAMNNDAAQPFIRSNHGYAGMSGRAVHAIACSNVSKFYTLFHHNDDNNSTRSSSSTNIDIVGCGGVENACHVVNLMLCGACAVQVGTTHWKEGPDCFDRIAAELCVWMQQEHVVSLYRHDFKISNLIGAAAMHHRHHGHGGAGHGDEEEEEWSSQRASQARNIKKKMEQAVTTKSIDQQQQQQQCTSELNFYKFTTAFLIVVVAIMAADKWNHHDTGGGAAFFLLPTE